MIIDNQGEEKKIIALFMDIRGFSHMFEMLPDEKVFMFTNRYFTKASEIIDQYMGTLDNIIGDGILAIWGKDSWEEKTPFFAVRAALEMRMALLRQNIQYKWEAHFPLEIGIGLGMGDALHCFVGPPGKTIDTFFGMPVIRASRLGNLARHNSIFIDRTTAKAVNKWARLGRLQETPMQGLKKRIVAFRVDGLMDFSRKNGERRKTSFIRYVFPEIVAMVFKKDGTRKPAILRNISPSGAGIEIVEKKNYDLNEQDEITLDLKTFKLPQCTSIHGKIVQVRPISEETDVERRLSQVGIEFIDVDPSTLNVLKYLNIA